MHHSKFGDVLMGMLAVRLHFVGVTVVVALCLGTAAVVTYQRSEHERTVHEAAARDARASASLAIRESQEALDRLAALVRELDAIDAEIQELVDRIERASAGSEEAQRARGELLRLRQKHLERVRQHQPVRDDRLIPRQRGRNLETS